MARSDSTEVAVYLYFADRDAVDGAAAALHGGGWETTSRPDEDRVALVGRKRFRQSDVDAELAEIEEKMEEIAERFGGEYDGFDREVPGVG